MHSPAANLHDSDSTVMAVETTIHDGRTDGVDKMRGGLYQAYDFGMYEHNYDKLFAQELFVPKSMSRSFLVGSTTSLSSSHLSRQDAVMTVGDSGRDNQDDGCISEDKGRQENDKYEGDIHSVELQDEPEDVMHHDGVPVEVYFQTEDHREVAQEKRQDHNKQHCNNEQFCKECLALVKEIDKHLLEYRLVSEYPVYDCGHDHNYSACSCMLYGSYELNKPCKLTHERRDTVMKIFAEAVKDDDNSGEEEDGIINCTHSNVPFVPP